MQYYLSCSHENSILQNPNAKQTILSHEGNLWETVEHFTEQASQEKSKVGVGPRKLSDVGVLVPLGLILYLSPLPQPWLHFSLLQ